MSWIPSKALCVLCCVCHTLQTHDAAHDDDVARPALLHVWHHLFDHAHHTKEVGLKHLLHLLHTDALNGTQEPDPCIVD